MVLNDQLVGIQRYERKLEHGSYLLNNHRAITQAYYTLLSQNVALAQNVQTAKALLTHYVAMRAKMDAAEAEIVALKGRIQSSVAERAVRLLREELEKPEVQALYMERALERLGQIALHPLRFQ